MVNWGHGESSVSATASAHSQKSVIDRRREPGKILPRSSVPSLFDQDLRGAAGLLDTMESDKPYFAKDNFVEKAIREAEFCI